jgi:thiaminase
MTNRKQKPVTHTFYMLKENKNQYYKKSIEDYFTDEALEYFTENPRSVEIVTLGRNKKLIKELEKYFEGRKNDN